MSLLVDIQKQYKGFRLDVKLNSIESSIGLLGASGCGKSLTLKCIAGIETPDSGKIILNDRILFDSEQGINIPVQQRNVGMLFQNYALFPNMTVRKNIELGMTDKKGRQKRLETMVQLFRLEGTLNKYPHQLSGGEQQRVALARCMSLEPELQMFDEPFYALDSFLKDKLQQELLEMLQEYKGEILMVSHSRDELYRFCKTIAAMQDGHIVESGSRTEIFCNPKEIATAKLTGCKNISRVEKVTDYIVRALDWNVCLSTDRFVQEDICFVGIRAHNIRAGKRKEAGTEIEARLETEAGTDIGINTGTEQENMIPVTLAELSEGPFEYQLIFHIKVNPKEDSKLWWIISKQEWNNTIKGNIPDHIIIPREDILLLVNHS